MGSLRQAQDDNKLVSLSLSKDKVIMAKDYKMYSKRL